MQGSWSRLSYSVRGGILAMALATIVLPLNIPSWGQSGSAAGGHAGSGIPVVQSDKAEENLLRRVSPFYPPLAQMAQVQGIVRLRIFISKTGDVESCNYLSGPLMLMQSAIDAVKQWKFKPFLVEDQPAEVSVEIELPFFLGVSDAEMQMYMKRDEEFKSQEKECRALLEANKYVEAEVSCNSLVDVAGQLHKSQRLERMTADDLSGEALLFQKKFPQALECLKRALGIGESALNPTSAELGSLYHHAAWGYQGAGDMKKALSYYEKAENILRKARDREGAGEFKDLDAKRLQAVLADYIHLLRQIGQQGAADKAQIRADAIAKEIRPR